VRLKQSRAMTTPKVTIACGAPWQEVAVDRQAYRDTTISAVEPVLPSIADVQSNTISLAKQLLTAEEIRITESTVEELIPEITNSSLSAVSVANAFLRRAGLAQKAVSLL